MGQGYQYAVSIVTGFKDALKLVTSWNAEERQRKMKMKMKTKNELKDWGGALFFGMTFWTPFALHILGVI